MTGAGLAIEAQVVRGAFTLDVGLRAAPGEVVAVLGPNGAGKSTLLAAVAGLTPVQAGRVVLDDVVLDDAGTGIFVEPAGRPVGFVFQGYRLFPHLTVLDNVAFAPRARGAGRVRSRAVAHEWIARLGLEELAARRPRELSGGQAQRVALARALAGDPAVLLLDEPLAALDARTRLDVQGELTRHLAVFAGPSLLVTHDPLEALVLADRIVVLEDGRVVQAGSPADVARRPATEYVARLVGLNLYAGVADGDAVHLDGGGTLHVPDHGEHGAVLVALRPSAVVLSPHRPEGTSARNTWPATVVGLTMLTDRVRVALEGEPSALVDVTPAAVAELGIAPGGRLWLSAKATEIEVYLRP